LRRTPIVDMVPRIMRFRENDSAESELRRVRSFRREPHLGNKRPKICQHG
jgi:hypothetical protein